MGGYRSGKTHALLRASIIGHLTKMNPKDNLSNGWAVYPRLGLAKEIYVPEINKILESAKIDYTYNKAEMVYKSRYGRQAIYSLQTPKMAIGSELTHIEIDEFDTVNVELAKEWFEKAIGRLNGSPDAQLSIGTTPEGFKYTYYLETNNMLTAFHASTYDNPYVDKSYIEHLESIYDPEVAKQYLLGQYVNTVGKQAYYSFNRQYNIFMNDYVLEGEDIYIGIDFNVDNFSIVCSQYIRGVLNVFREYRYKNFRTEDAVKLLEDTFPNNRLTIFPDMTGGARHTSSAYSDIIQLRAGRTRIAPFAIRGNVNNYPHKVRLQTVNNALSKSRILIHKSCNWLIGDMDKVITDSFYNIDKKGENQGINHMSDAFGYIVMQVLPISERKLGYVG